MPPKTAKTIELPGNFKHLSEEEKLHFYIRNSDEVSNLDALVKESPNFDFQSLNIEIIPEEVEDPDSEAGTSLPHPIETLLQACVRIGDRLNAFAWLLTNGADPSIYPPNQPSLFNLIADSEFCQQYLEILVTFWGNTLESTTSTKNSDEDSDIEKPEWNREGFLPALNMPHPKSGKTPILVTLKRKDDISTSILLQLGATFNFNSSAQFDNGEENEPLYHYAIRVGDAQLIHCLWNCGITPFMKDKQRKTILHVAVENDKKEMIEVLQKKIGKIPEEFVNAENVYGDSIVDTCIESENIEMLKLLTSKIAANINHLNPKSGLRPVHRASLNGKINIVEQLISIFKVKSSEIDSFGNTPLHYASLKGDVTLTKLLLDKKADATIANTVDSSLPIHFAASCGSAEILQMLINDKKADVNVLNGRRESPLHIASSQGHLDVVSILLERKDTNIELEDANGYTPLERAINNSQQDVSKMLINHGAKFDRKSHAQGNVTENIDGSDYSYNTLFHQTVSNDFDIVVESMIQSGKVSQDMINCRDSLGRTPFFVATSKNNISMANILLQHADLDVNIPETTYGISPLILSCKLGYEALEHLILENNGNVEQATFEGKVALHYAAGVENIRMTELLLQSGARVDPIDHNGRTPLFDACAQNNAEIIQLLLQNNAKIEHQDKNGSRAIHYAVQHRSTGAVEVLCKEGAILNCEDHIGRTPLIIATQYCAETCSPLIVHHFKERQGKSKEEVEEVEVEEVEKEE